MASSLDNSALIDELHTVGTFVGGDVQRRLAVLRSLQRASRAPGTRRAIVEQGGLLPLIRCYSSPHPAVRLEAAKALQIIALDPANYAELGIYGLLQQLMPMLLTSSDNSAHSHALAALMLACEQSAANQMSLELEGLLDPLIEAVASADVNVARNALGALSVLCRMSSVSVRAMRRGVAAQILVAARLGDEPTQLAALRVLSGLAAASENLAPVVNSGCLVFIISSTSVPALRLEAARCLEVLLRNIFEGAHLLTDKEATLFTTLTHIQINRERTREDHVASFEVMGARNQVLCALVLQPLSPLNPRCFPFLLIFLISPLLYFFCCCYSFLPLRLRCEKIILFPTSRTVTCCRSWQAV